MVDVHPIIIQCDEEMSIIDVCRKVARERNRENSVEIRANNKSSEQQILSKQCTDTFRDSHDASRHKSRRTLAYSFQQFHLPFHLRFVTLDLCSGDSHLRLDDGRTPFKYLLGTPYVSNLSMFGESVFAIIPIMKCEQPSCRTDGSVVAGGDEMLRRMNTWWRRSMVYLSAHQFAENLLECNGADVKRSKLMGRN